MSLAVIAFGPFESLDWMDRRAALRVRSVTNVITLLSGLCEAAFHVTGRYASSTVAAISALRLAEWGCGVAGLLGSGTYAAVAPGGLLARVTGAALAQGLLRPRCSAA